MGDRRVECAVTSIARRLRTGPRPSTVAQRGRYRTATNVPIDRAERPPAMTRISCAQAALAYRQQLASESLALRRASPTEPKGDSAFVHEGRVSAQGVGNS